MGLSGVNYPLLPCTGSIFLHNFPCICISFRQLVLQPSQRFKRLFADLHNLGFNERKSHGLAPLELQSFSKTMDRRQEGPFQLRRGAPGAPFVVFGVALAVSAQRAIGLHPPLGRMHNLPLQNMR